MKGRNAAEIEYNAWKAYDECDIATCPNHARSRFGEDTHFDWTLRLVERAHQMGRQWEAVQAPPPRGVLVLGSPLVEGAP